MDSGPRNEQDLHALIGQYESIRLDFKASALLSQPQDRIVKQLTEDVSAFANTEGGVIVIGLRESKSGKRSVAAEVDEGVDPDQMSPERLEQLIASNMSPPVPGLAVRPIALSGDKAGRLAYAVSVPRGSTAYQARHSLLYYGRSEFAAAPLHDNVIRMLMNRGRYAHAAIEPEAVGHHRPVDYFRDGIKPTGEQSLGIAATFQELLPHLEKAFDVCAFRLFMTNDGPVTIRDALRSVTVRGSSEVRCIGGAGSTSDWRTTFFEGNPLPGSPDQPWLLRFADSGQSSRLFPEQRVPFPGAEFALYAPPTSPSPSARIEWRLYLDDAPSSAGSVEITSFSVSTP